MKNKIIAVGLMAVVGAVILPGGVLATSKINNVEATIEAQINQDQNNKLSPGNSPLWYKFKSDFKINQPVKDGNFFEIELQGLPGFYKGDVFSGSNKTTPIGKITCKTLYWGASYYQAFYAGDSSGFANTDPKDSLKEQCTVVLNKEAEKLKDISFGFDIKGRPAYALANRKYQALVYVKVNDNTVFQDEVTVPEKTKSGAMITHLGHSSTTFYTNDVNEIRSVFTYTTPKNSVGSTIDIEIADEFYVFSKKEKQLTSKKASSVFIYNDNSIVNQFGLIKNSGEGHLYWSNEAFTEKNATIKITEQTADAFSTGINYLAIEPTETAKKYFNEHGELPKIKYNLRINNADGVKIFESKSDSKIIISGNNPTFKSEEEKKEESEEKSEDNSKTPVEEPKEYIENISTPNTGAYLADNGFVVFGIISLFSALVLATFKFFSKKQSKIRF